MDGSEAGAADDLSLTQKENEGRHVGRARGKLLKGIDPAGIALAVRGAVSFELKGGSKYGDVV